MAVRFRFRLEVVRTLRKRAQDEQRRVVAECVRRQRQLTRRIEDVNRALRGNVELTRATSNTVAIDVRSLRLGHAYMGRLQHRVIEARAELSECDGELNAEREKLADATGQVKAIEKLREKKWERHCTKVRRDEQAAMDEAALQMYGRGRQAHSEGGYPR